MERILVIGCSGQIGSELTLALRKMYGNENVFATDIKQPPKDILEGGPFNTLDVMDYNNLLHFAVRFKITQVYNLAAVLSGNAEKIPQQAWEINMRALMNTLELARDSDAKKLFWPSSIAVFGPTTPREMTPQFTVMEPSSVYGISKQAGERWCEYYFNRYGVDVRSVRYPGLIGHRSEPGGGTTDYAVDIFYHALKSGSYTSFLSENTMLPMMMMDDAIRATIGIMDAPAEQIKIRGSYNLAGMSFTPAQLAAEISKHIPDFAIQYSPDFRQALADSWPDSIDDSRARTDWGWKAAYDTSKLVDEMIREVGRKIQVKL